jgi:hypothetical protein
MGGGLDRSHRTALVFIYMFDRSNRHPLTVMRTVLQGHVGVCERRCGMGPNGCVLRGVDLSNRGTWNIRNRISRLDDSEEDGLRCPPYVTMIEELSSWLPSGSQHWPGCPSYQGALLFAFSTLQYNHGLNVIVVSAASGLRRYVTNLTDSRSLRRHNFGPIDALSCSGRCHCRLSPFRRLQLSTACRNQRFLELQIFPKSSRDVTPESAAWYSMTTAF